MLTFFSDFFMKSKHVVKHFEELYSEEKRARLQQKWQRQKKKWNWGEKSKAGWKKKKRDLARRAVFLFVFSKKDTEHEQNTLSATMSYCREIGRKELHCMLRHSCSGPWATWN